MGTNGDGRGEGGADGRADGGADSQLDNQADSHVEVGGDRRRGAVEQAYGEILRRIDLRRFLPGERLPAATALAAEIGVSRMAVLQALRMLESEQRVTVRPGRAGTRVNRPELSRDARLARAWQKRDTLVQINALMEVVEPGVARFLARHGIGPEAVAELRDINDRIRSTSDLDELLGLENRFHSVLGAATGQKILEVLVIAGRQQVSSIWDLLDTAQPSPAALAAEHDQLLTAIVAGDGRAAGDLAGRHVDAVLDAISETFGPEATPGPSPTRTPTRSTTRSTRRRTRRPAAGRASSS